MATYQALSSEIRILPFSEVPESEIMPRLPAEEGILTAEAVSFLSQYTLLSDRIRQQLRFQNRLKDQSRRGDAAASAIVGRMRETEDSYNRDIDRLLNLKNLILQFLNRLSRPEAAQLLTEIYLNRQTVPKAASRLGYARRTAYRLRRQGLAELGALLAENNRKSSA